MWYIGSGQGLGNPYGLAAVIAIVIIIIIIIIIIIM
jgi:hypothetical protein